MQFCRNTRLVNLAVALLMAASAASCSRPVHEAATLVLVDVNVITMRDQEVLEDHMVVISEERIIAVEPTDRRRVPAGVQLVPGNGAYVLPGFTDMHVHVLHDADDALERTLPLLVVNGITTARDMGSELSVLTEVRARLEAGPGYSAPRLFAAGPLLDGTQKPWYGDLPLILETPEDVRERLPGLREAGVDFFKTYDDLDAATFAEIAAESKDMGLDFVGHVPGGVSIMEAVEAGQRTIEHLGISTVKDCVDGPEDWFERAIDAKFRQGYDAYYRLLVDHWESVDWSRCAPVLDALSRPDVFFTPTLDMELNDGSRVELEAVRYMAPRSRTWCESVLERIEAADPLLREQAYEQHLDAFRRIREAGTQLLVGTDTPNNCVVVGFSFHGELARLIEAGLSPWEALRAATFDAARALGREEVAGLVEAGREADLVLLRRNPLDEIANTRSPAGVVLRGRWLDREELDAMLVAALSAAEQKGDAEP